MTKSSAHRLSIPQNSTLQASSDTTERPVHRRSREHRISDGMEIPLKLLSALHSLLKETLADGMMDATKLAKLRNMTGLIRGRCLQGELQRSHASQNKSVFTKKHEQSYACTNCVNNQRLCLSLTGGQMLVLPLHPLLRTFGRGDGAGPRPNELQYCVSTTKAP